MEAFKRLAMAYLGVGFVIAVIENWTANARGGVSVLDVIGSVSPIGVKVGVVFDQVVVPIVAWPLHVLAMIRGG
jgi:hypothetical protein